MRIHSCLAFISIPGVRTVLNQVLASLNWNSNRILSLLNFSMILSGLLIPVIAEILSILSFTFGSSLIKSDKLASGRVLRMHKSMLRKPLINTVPSDIRWTLIPLRNSPLLWSREKASVIWLVLKYRVDVFEIQFRTAWALL